MNIHPPISYFFTVLIILFAAAGIKKSRSIDVLAESIMKNNNERNALMMLSSLSYILAPVFLLFVLISSFEKWTLRFKNKSRALTLLTSSALMGSILLPFGNLRNIYISIFRGGGNPGPGMINFIRTLLPLWITGFIIVMVFTYVYTERENISSKKSKNKFRWKELLFASILLFFIIIFFSGKMNVIGFTFITGAFTFAFMSKETFKEVDWWVLIPVILSFPVFYLLRTINIEISSWPGFIMGTLSSSIITSNITAYALPHMLTADKFIIYAVSLGSLGGIAGSAATIWLFRKSRTDIEWKLMFKIYGVFLIAGIVILLTGGVNG